MGEIVVEHDPSQERLDALGIGGWPIWEKECSKFAWRYDSRETFYVLEGEVTITPDGGAPIKVGKGDLVQCPSGLSCTWEVRHPIRKHYRMD